MLGEPGDLWFPHPRIRHPGVQKYNRKSGTRASIVDASAVELDFH
jgi:hypothetical protein